MTKENAIRFMELFMRKASENQFEFSDKDKTTGKIEQYKYAKLSIVNVDYYDVLHQILSKASYEYPNLIRHFQISLDENHKELFYESVDEILNKYHLPIKGHQDTVFVAISSKVNEQMKLSFLKSLLINQKKKAYQEFMLLEQEMEKLVHRFSFDSYFAQIHYHTKEHEKKFQKTKHPVSALS
ncbi:MAG: hypothetical protein KH135_00160 [Firmicutes bacterium]|nr:hypothetical protein [Bacillota bacterium]